MAIMMNTGPKSTFRYQNINISGRNLRLHNISILLTTKITSVQHLHTINFDHKHGSTNDMTCNIRCYFYALFFYLYTEFDLADTSQGLGNMLLGEKYFILISDFQRVFDQVMVDMLGGFSHVDLLLVIIFSQEIRQCSTMIQMGMSNDHHRQLLGIEFIEQWQSLFTTFIDHEPTIKHNIFVIYCQDYARATHLTPCTQWQY